MSLRVLSLALIAALAMPVIGGPPPAEAGKRFSTVTNQFTNSAAIAIPDLGNAVPYPSVINVSGFKQGTIKDVKVVLHGFSHTFPRDVDMLLIGPNGENVILMSDIPTGVDAASLTLTFDARAVTPLPTTGEGLISGTFLPTNFDDGGGPDTFPGQTPSGNTALAIFNGDNPNGLWQLFIVDDQAPDSGSITSWELQITAKVKNKKAKKHHHHQQGGHEGKR